MSRPQYRKRRRIGRKLAVAVLLFFGAYAAWVAVWSREGNTLTPVRLGVDRCHHCGMIVSDLRYSISILDRDDGGHIVTRHFDDPGCFQAFAKQYPNRKFIGIAHDFESGKEIPLDQVKLENRGIETPMGSGVVAVEVQGR